MLEDLRSWALERGYAVAWSGASVIEDVWKDFRRRLERGELDPAFYRENLEWFRFPLDVPLSAPKSLVLAAVPRPVLVLGFHVSNRRLDVAIPPTYFRFEETKQGVRADFASSVLRGGHDAIILPAPLKAVAGRMGFVEYGRNNITYLPGRGSYFQLVGLLSDAEIDETSPGNPAPAACQDCEGCGLCIEACPFGAIQADRFLIDARRCFAGHSERPGPWPEWFTPPLVPKWNGHPCLIGCMACQEACPMNSGRLTIEKADVFFTSEETERMVDGMKNPADDLSRGIRKKLERLGMTEHLPVLGRNLDAVIRGRTRNP